MFNVVNPFIFCFYVRQLYWTEIRLTSGKAGCSWLFSCIIIAVQARYEIYYFWFLLGKAELVFQGSMRFFGFQLQRERLGAVFWALAFHQCGSGSIPDSTSYVHGLSLLVLFFALKSFFCVLLFLLPSFVSSSSSSPTSSSSSSSSTSSSWPSSCSIVIDINTNVITSMHGDPFESSWKSHISSLA